MDTQDQALQVRVGRTKQRRRTIQERREIVEETLEPGASVARVARARGVNANQVFAWRRQYRQGLLGEGNAETVNLLPVHVTGATVRKTDGQLRRQAARRTTEAVGTIQVELPKGYLRISGRVDAEALRAVLEQLLG